MRTHARTHTHTQTQRKRTFTAWILMLYKFSGDRFLCQVACICQHLWHSAETLEYPSSSVVAITLPIVTECWIIYLFSLNGCCMSVHQPGRCLALLQQKGNYCAICHEILCLLFQPLYTIIQQYVCSVLLYCALWANILVYILASHFQQAKTGSLFIVLNTHWFLPLWSQMWCMSSVVCNSCYF
jgi:hypothetical protein